MHSIVAIVGRPNVGKSRLFNRLVGSGKAIVADTPGVTRDRHYAVCDWDGREFIIVDTGGLEFDSESKLGEHITRQSLAAVKEADIVICLFDGLSEPTAEDRDVVKILRKTGRPVIFAVNKIDWGGEERIGEYYRIGAEKMIPVSAEHGTGVDDLLDEVKSLLPKDQVMKEKKIYDVKVTVIGRPNVGKSTLINRLAGEERVIAHELAGTTRDAIDVEIDFNDKKYLFIDTAGVKRHIAVGENLEKFTAMKSLKAIDKAELVLLLMDASEGLTRQDQHLAAFVREEGKGMLVLVNKWDKVSEKWPEFEEKMRMWLGDLEDVPLLPVSAMTGFNCLKIFSNIEKIVKAMGTKITTSKLNEILGEALENHNLPACHGKSVRIYYATQTGVNPPTFSLFSNLPAAVPYAYRRYLTRKISEALGVTGIPVKVVCKRK